MIGKPRELAYKLVDLDKDKLYELKEYKFQRNKRQNAKYWKLLYELAKTLQMNVEELHFQMLKDFSKREYIMVEHGIEIRGIKYLEKRATIKNENGKLYDVYYYYTPSHELNTSEFAFLMTGLIQECEQQGIDTVSPDEKREFQMIVHEAMKNENTKKTQKTSRRVL